MEAEPEGAFPLFRFLPAELRLQIWRLSLPPRVILLFLDATYPPSCTSPTPQPTLLSVCHESRAECLRSLVLIPHINVYFNPGLDILYFPRPCSLLGYLTSSVPRLLLQVREHVTKVAVDYVSPDVRKEWEVYNKYSLLKAFPNLEEGYLVINSAAASYDDDRQSSLVREIELIDPRGDKAEIIGIMERVRESFCYELPPPSPVPEQENGEVAAKMEEKEEEEEKEKWVDGRIEYNGLELVPKAMVVTGACG
ncbi:hypothetical protein QBC40DRAFT_176377 [Triangularia verruculosa]|uniref:2EXR domain-containing protein n=1 Tax=Triangularia verruculosa TaxID=2587418 RepID=A0AAN7AUU7_9PEZI|nr:hypothetical protein QBC40DRAFT_176377 [Triangularia verruculosa]